VRREEDEEEERGGEINRENLEKSLTNYAIFPIILKPLPFPLRHRRRTRIFERDTQCVCTGDTMHMYCRQRRKMRSFLPAGEVALEISSLADGAGEAAGVGETASGVMLSFAVRVIVTEKRWREGAIVSLRERKREGGERRKEKERREGIEKQTEDTDGVRARKITVLSRFTPKDGRKLSEAVH
jgi:hypothetical protein